MNSEQERDEERRHFFDQSADGWEERNYSPELKSEVEQLAATLEIERGMTILDAGCGQGVLLPYLRKCAGNEGRLIALDASAPMLKNIAAKDSAAWAIHSSAENIPLIDEYVDMVVCFSAFPHFSDKAAAAKEFFRVLKPGGRAYVLHLGSSDMINRHHDSHHAVKGDHLPCAHGMQSIFKGAGFSQANLDEGEKHYRFSAVK